MPSMKMSPEMTIIRRAIAEKKDQMRPVRLASSAQKLPKYDDDNYIHVLRSIAIDEAAKCAVVNMETKQICVRYVTDCDKTSGLVFDRYLGREVPRVLLAWNGFVYDRLICQLRKRSMLDDLRRRNEDIPLDITEDELALDVNWDML